MTNDNHAPGSDAVAPTVGDDPVVRVPAAWRRTGDSVVVATVAAPDASITLEGMAAHVWLQLDGAPRRSALMAQVVAQVPEAEGSLVAMVDDALELLSAWKLIAGSSS